MHYMRITIYSFTKGLPAGFWEIEMDQLSPSVEKSRRSRESDIALVRRKSQKKLANLEITGTTAEWHQRWSLKSS